MGNNLPFNNLYDSLNLFPIQPDYSQYVAQLKGSDAVHAFGADNVDNLLKYRVGGPGQNRSCWGVRSSDCRLQAVLYMHKSVETAIRTPRDLVGKAEDILHKPISTIKGIPQSVVFYSITNLGVEGAGRTLILKLHERLNDLYRDENTVFSTLSPLRQPDAESSKLGINDFIDARAHEWDRRDDTGKRALALEFLLAGSERVERFHLGNGAVIGDLKLNADTKGKHRIMVNYIYPRDPEILKANAALFKKFKQEGGVLPSALVHPWLIEETAPYRPAHESRAQSGLVLVTATPPSAGMHIQGPV